MDGGLLSLCMLICASVNQCPLEFCEKRLTIYGSILEVDCIESLPFHFSAVSREELSFRTIHIENCDMQQFGEADAQLLKGGGLRSLGLTSVRLPESLSPLKHLDADLVTLTIIGSRLDDDLANTLPSLKGLSQLSLANNRLTSAPIVLSAFTSLTRLDISKNKLTRLDTTALPASLIDLIAADNSISQPQMTKELTSLRLLDLSRNSIEDLDWFTESRLVAECSYINLAHNKISLVEPENINFLTNLKSLNLQYNNITAIYMLGEINTIEEGTVDLSHNPLHCSCNTVFFARNELWQAQTLPTCQSPGPLGGQTLETLVAGANCKDEKPEGLISEVDKNQTPITVAILCVIGGIMCGVAAVAAVGYISRRRQVPGIVVAKNPLQSKLDMDNTPLFPKAGRKVANEIDEGDSGIKDFYVQRRRTTPVEAEEYVIDKLNEINRVGRSLVESQAEPCLEVQMLHTFTLEEADDVDASDMCSLLIKEWPIAPCNTPWENFATMYYEGDMEEWPMTTLNTRVASSSDIPNLLEGVTEALLTVPNSRSTSYIEIGKGNRLSVPQLIVPPNSTATIPPINDLNSESAVTVVVNKIDGW